MKIVFISDTHNLHDKLNILPCDILCHTGDFSITGYDFELKNFLKWFNEQPAKHKIFLSGNHDFVCIKNPDYLSELLKNYEDIYYLQEDVIVLEGLKFYGSPWIPFDWEAPFAYKKENVDMAKSIWDKIPNDTDILLTHCPPYQVADKILKPKGDEDPHKGCKVLLEKTKGFKNLIHAFGHIHEGYGLNFIEGITYINSAVVNKNKVSKAPILLEL